MAKKKVISKEIVDSIENCESKETCNCDTSIENCESKETCNCDTSIENCESKETCNCDTSIGNCEACSSEVNIENESISLDVQEDGAAVIVERKLPDNKFLAAIDNYFGVTKSGSNFKTEIIAGVTTFMAMAYILIVNPTILSGSNGGNLPANINSAFYVATCLSAVIGTLIMSLHAKLPFAQASGMGLNAYFAYSVVNGTNGLTLANGLLIILISGLLFLTLTLVGVREKIVDAIPKGVKDAIPAGIGLFIAFIGLQSAKIIQSNPATLIAMADLNFLAVPFGIIAPMITTFVAFMLIAILSKLKVKGAILWGILGGTVLHYVMGYAGAFIDPFNSGELANTVAFYGNDTIIGYLNSVGGNYASTAVVTSDNLLQFLIGNNAGTLAPNFSAEMLNPINGFAVWGTELVGKVFTEGFIFKGDAAVIVGVFISAVLAFCMVDMFDTIGTLVGTAKKADMLDADGKLPRMKQALLADSIATCTGAICGTTTVTTFVESSAGVAEGGRTGLTSLVVAGLFFVALFLTPLAYLIPSSATAAALIYVGVLMISSVKDIDFNDVSIAVPAFLTLSMMAFTYNISFGIGLGLITHCIIRLCTGVYFKKGTNCKELKGDILTMVLAVLFVLNFVLVSH